MGGDPSPSMSRRTGPRAGVPDPTTPDRNAHDAFNPASARGLRHPRAPPNRLNPASARGLRLNTAHPPGAAMAPSDDAGGRRDAGARRVLPGRVGLRRPEGP